MSFFPSTLFVNPITGLLSDKPSDITGIAPRSTDAAYQLQSAKGCRAIYKHASGYTMIVVGAGMGKYKQYAAI